MLLHPSKTIVDTNNNNKRKEITTKSDCAVCQFCGEGFELQNAMVRYLGETNIKFHSTKRIINNLTIFAAVHNTKKKMEIRK